ncbi:1-deoxy-D-xylulose-5-phosphate reductoisomerase [Reyranella sp.]|uniref:1-deoxy-D-xylulose-5-phosphate reductoisomerase n=1 Tax=Reyranella sp. TaxID=1929291 RepID=UPI002721E3FB|nr:1-deoxy-D-xylulose-5-phosphate reductoisomerase [Reyranella sp.]MDO8974838.1 1-deoxy-D-xylulose-5-phosphate reductoisomerase [Reyranella sp.]MDP3241669.1 1-deoxy-D-xylulose-5-phosphate reductoisomerase [Reyranella sp.]
MTRWVAPSPEKPRGVTILGSTGSVGQSTVDLIARDPASYRVEALVARSSVELLAEQARRLRARLAVVADAERYQALKSALAGTSIEVAAGPEAVIEAAQRPAEWVMAAVVGFAGLAPTLAAARRGALVALANKEALVCAGRLLIDAIEQSGGVLLPVDSEHNAIFQVFEPDHHRAVDRLILTASGGPFRNWSLADMADVTPEQALAHPNWDMGDKISIDSATMMNKGLELIEAQLLFGLPETQVDIVVHPQSVIHSMVAYRDGSVLAQLGTADMRIPISHALGWPARIDGPSAKLDFMTIPALTFERPDSGRFPALRLAREALVSGGYAPIVLNAANEAAVAAFLARRIGFLDIARIVEDVMSGWNGLSDEVDGLQQVQAADLEARRQAESFCRAKARGI